MHQISLKIYEHFRAAVVEFRRQHGVFSVPFWKLGLLDSVDFDPGCLRVELCNALIAGSFREMHVPAFLTFVQTQAAGHGYRLWDETVIPLLAGTGTEGKNHQPQLRAAFDGEHPFRSALRKWLSEQRRSDTYQRDGLHFWFVRAVIGECALVGISKEFAELFLGSLFRDSFKGGELREIVRERFQNQIESFGRGRERREIESIKVLEDCLVEAGLLVLEIVRVLKNGTPPTEGWDVEGLLNESQKTGQVQLGALPPLVLEIIRERVKTEVKNLDLGQLLAVLRRTPGSQVRAGTLKWSLSDLLPPPITLADVWQGASRLGSFHLVDDLGRGADELLGMAPSLGWEITGDVAWKLDRHPFQANHPSRVRSQARPVLRLGEDRTQAKRWVLTLPQKEFTSTTEQIRNASGRFFLRAWPALDHDCRPIFFVRGFYLPTGWVGTVRLEIQEQPGSMWTSVWEGSARRGEVITRRTVAAMPGHLTTFRLVGGLENGEEVSREVRFSWPLPALFLDGRRIPPGEQLAPSQGNFSLFCSQTPVVDGRHDGRALNPVASSHTWNHYQFSRHGSDCLSVRADGKCWEILSRPPITLRIWLEPAQTQERRPDRKRYGGSEGADIFFRDVPSLVVEFLTNGASDVDLQSLIRRTVVLAGNEDDAGGVVRRPLADLIPESQEGPFRFSLSEIMPRILVEPGFDVRWVRLLDGSMGDSSDDLGDLPGQVRHFIVLPHALESVLPRRPGKGGQLRLDDPLQIFEPLILEETGGNVLPVPGMHITPQVRVGTALSFLDHRIEALLSFPLLGCWFKESRWTIADLNRLLEEQSGPCALVIVPDGECLQLRLEDLGGHELARRTISGPCSREMTFQEICPITQGTSEEDQRRWLSAPGSRLVCQWKECNCGQVEFDHRGTVTDFLVVARQTPDPIGATNIQMEIGFLKGLSSQEEVLMVLTRTGEDRSVEIDRRFILFSGADFEEIIHTETITLPSPGIYRVDLLRQDEDQVLASLELQGEKPIPPPIPLEELLELLPEAPKLEQLIQVYRHIQMNHEVLQGDKAPWSGCTCYARLDGLWHSTPSGSRTQRLLGVLRAYSDGLNRWSLGPVEPASVCDAQGEAFLEVSTVMLHLYLYTDAAIRYGLDEWEREIEKFGRESQLDPAALRWCEILSVACRRLRNKPAHSTWTAKDEKLGVKPWFPCRPEFLRFLEGSSASRATPVLATR